MCGDESHQWQRKAQTQLVLKKNLNVMQAELLKLNAAEVVDIRGVPFHFLQFKFHLGLCNYLLLARANNPRFLPESPGAAAPA